MAVEVVEVVANYCWVVVEVPAATKYSVAVVVVDPSCYYSVVEAGTVGSVDSNRLLVLVVADPSCLRFLAVVAADCPTVADPAVVVPVPSYCCFPVAVDHPTVVVSAVHRLDPTVVVVVVVGMVVPDCCSDRSSRRLLGHPVDPTDPGPVQGMQAGHTVRG